MDDLNPVSRDADATTSDGPVTPALSVACLAAVLASALGSALAVDLLPEAVRIHWTLGLGPYYGPEFAPGWVVLAGFPLVTAAIALAAHGIPRRVAAAESLAPLRAHYLTAVLATLGTILAAQAALVAVTLA